MAIVSWYSFCCIHYDMIVLSSDIYRGPNVWSEPETKAIHDFILGNPNINWQVSLSVHSYQQVWISPWGDSYAFPRKHALATNRTMADLVQKHDWLLLADYAAHKALGIRATNALRAVHGTVYQVGTVTELLSKCCNYQFCELQDNNTHGSYDHCLNWYRSRSRWLWRLGMLQDNIPN